MSIKSYITPIIGITFLVASAGAFAKVPVNCHLPAKLERKISHLDKAKQWKITKSFERSCMRNMKLSQLIKAKKSMLNAVMKQPKIDTLRVKKLVRKITNLQKRKLQTITNRNIEMAKYSSIRLGLSKPRPKMNKNLPSRQVH